MPRVLKLTLLSSRLQTRNNAHKYRYKKRILKTDPHLEAARLLTGLPNGRMWPLCLQFAIALTKGCCNAFTNANIFYIFGRNHTAMRFIIFTVCLSILAAQAMAAWCNCYDNGVSDECCQKIMNAKTFWSINSGHTCDVGPSSNGKASEFLYCCRYREGPGSGCS
jgi:hypothetical protein